MSALLDTIYSIAVLFVAVAGMAYVFAGTDVNSDEGPRWTQWIGVAVVGVFLAAMIWLTIA
jgi:type IV secretory pathway VirB2 component (pilin)